MTTDLLAERKRLREEKNKIDAQMKATAAEIAYNTLVQRYNENDNKNNHGSGVKMPKRHCFNLLPHRYGDTPHGNMAQDKMTMPMFFNLAELLAGSDIIKVVGDETYFQLATELLNDQPLPRLWAVLILDWIEESPDLAPAFFSEMADFYKTNKPANIKPSRKRKNTGGPPLSSLNKRRWRESTDGTDAIAIDKSLTKNNGNTPVQDNTHAHAQTGTCEGNPGPSEPGDDNRPSEALLPSQVQSQPVASTGVEFPPTNKCASTASKNKCLIWQHIGEIARLYQESPPDQGWSRLAGNQIAVAFSVCNLAVYPRRVIADLVTESKEDVTFTRFGSIYRSHHIGRTRFCVYLSEEKMRQILTQSSFDHDEIRIRSLAMANFFDNGDYPVTSLFLPKRGSVTHIVKGCDLVWDSQQHYVPFLSHLAKIRADIFELTTLKDMFSEWKMGSQVPET